VGGTALDDHSSMHSGAKYEVNQPCQSQGPHVEEKGQESCQQVHVHQVDLP